MGKKDTLITEENFTLPIGYRDKEGTLHKKGTMRLATAGDEILPMRDPRVVQNPDFLNIIILSRVVTNLGTLDDVNTQVIQDLFLKDYEYLLGLYNRFNENGYDAMKTQCPKCQTEIIVEVPKPGE